MVASALHSESLSRRGVLEKTLLSTATTFSGFGGVLQPGADAGEPLMFESYKVVHNANSATDAKLQSIEVRTTTYTTSYDTGNCLRHPPYPV